MAQRRVGQPREFSTDPLVAHGPIEGRHMPVKPALTPAQWNEVVLSNDRDGLRQKYADTPHAQAAIALYNKPFGFSERHVSALRDAAQLAQATRKSDAALLEQAADAIAALLPLGRAS